VLFIDVHGEQERLAGSLCNELELAQTLQLVEKLLARGLMASELAVITPYRGQLERLRQGFAQRRVPLEYSSELMETEGPRWSSQSGLALGTVHRFQGGERSVVLFSSVVTRASSLAFLNTQPNLLNVAISRAQHHLVCLGHRAVLELGAKTRVLTRAAQDLVVG
jgi:superfamily I DNA and/or RNA helicase